MLGLELEVLGADDLVRIVAAADEAPVLDLVDDLYALLGVPRLGRDVDPVHSDDVVFAVATAAVAVRRARGAGAPGVRSA